MKLKGSVFLKLSLALLKDFAGGGGEGWPTFSVQHTFLSGRNNVTKFQSYELPSLGRGFSFIQYP